MHCAFFQRHYTQLQLLLETPSELITSVIEERSKQDKKSPSSGGLEIFLVEQSTLLIKRLDIRLNLSLAHTTGV